jgi:hypothetical protein
MTTTNSIKNFVLGIQKDCAEALLPPESGLNASGQSVIPKAIISVHPETSIFVGELVPVSNI